MTAVPEPSTHWYSFRDHVACISDWLDREASALYQDHPLAQHWARVSKIAEELGEATSALIGITGQNPRKGVYGTQDDLLSELADVAWTAVLAIQHFTGDAYTTEDIMLAKLGAIARRAQSS